jgi:hydrogenase maturation protein HypF
VVLNLPLLEGVLNLSPSGGGEGGGIKVDEMSESKCQLIQSTTTMDESFGTILSKKIKVRGVVQGIGFRPFIYRLALQNNLKGYVFNTTADVTIVIEGAQPDLDSFINHLEESAPPQSHIESVSIEEAPVKGLLQFTIEASRVQDQEYQLVSPDIATCDFCKKEIFDPLNRRYQYPFTNCTNCGPRFTIIEAMPYDRKNTTMREFTMCPQCSKEYNDINDRRFHAQPNACPECGPVLHLTDSSGKPVDGDPLSGSADLLKKGKILAIKGLGGFLLACDATDDAAVALLRERKRRGAKPFAVMMATINEIERCCQVSAQEKTLLESSQAPIVLLKQRAQASMLSPFIAPGTGYLGVMLPYTPLHHLLLSKFDKPLVMTSGNISEEPIAADNDEALRRLSGIADYFIMHNRDIYSRYDDSVTMVVNSGMQVIRRARGLAPYPIKLPLNVRNVLACGGETKNSFCMTRENHAFLSQHIGDLENLETLEHFEGTIELYKKMFHIEPEIIAYDMHPDYLSTKHALGLIISTGLKGVPVQHHHAHIVSCMVDNSVSEPVIGVAFDGTGYGGDGTIWGAEFLLADYSGFKRLAHFEYIALPGGKAAIEKPYRTTLSYLFKIFGDEVFELDLPFLKGIGRDEVALIKTQIERKINTPSASSCGRLFDAVSAVLDIRKETDFEGQAAVELESVAELSDEDGYPFDLIEKDGVKVVSFDRMFRSIIDDMNQKKPASYIAGRFHQTIAEVILNVCRILFKETSINRVALSGGVFQNRLLLELTIKKLEEEGLMVLIHHNVPANDGGIALGQAVIANNYIRSFQ